MSVIVNWRGSDALQAGSAKAPTDTGLLTGNPAAKDTAGREYLEKRELAVNTNAVDPCIFLRTSDDKVAKFRPTSGLTLVNTEADLPSLTAGASALHDGDTFLVRYAPDGHTPLNRLVVFDQALHKGAGDWNWTVTPSSYVRGLVSDAGAKPIGTARQHLVRGDLQATLEPGKTMLQAWDGSQWVTVWGAQEYEHTHPTLRWAGRFSDLPVPSATESIPHGQSYLVRLDLAGHPLDRLFVWYEKHAATATQPQSGMWHVVDPMNWVKSLAADHDNKTDAKEGDLTIVTEKDKEEIKVFSGGHWHTIPATSTAQVKNWIASLSLFEGTVQQVGGTIVGADPLDTLPDLLSTTPDDVAANLGRTGHYWIYVGPDYTVQKTDSRGMGRDLTGAVLRSGEWIMVANRGTAAAPKLNYVHVPSDLLTYSRSIDLYSHQSWRPGSWERNSLVTYRGSLWRAEQAVVPTDGAPSGEGAVAQVELVILNPTAALPAGTIFTVTINDSDCTYAMVAANEPQVTVRDRLLAAIAAKPEVDNLIDSDAGVADDEIVLKARNPGLPFTVKVSANAIVGNSVPNVAPSPWLKVDITGGIQFVPTVAELPPTAPREEVFFVLSHSGAGGNGALVYYDSGASAWQLLGGGGKPMKLTGGQLMLNIGVPIGSIMAWPTATPPSGWLLCDGSALDPLAYPELSRLLATNSAITAGHLPDLRGAFLRGAGGVPGGWGDPARQPGSSQEDATRAPRGPAFTTSTTVNLNAALTVNGTAASSGDHLHALILRATNSTQNLTHWQRASASGEVPDHWEATAGTTDTAGAHTHTVSGTATGNVAGVATGTVTGGGDGETRPVNVATSWIIKAIDNATTIRV